MIPGLVSNCWQRLIQQGASLVDLVGIARRQGYRAVELRQGSLAECESDNGQPLVDHLKNLSDAFPDMLTNLAAAMPFLSGQLSLSDGDFQAWQAAAVEMSAVPHLRLVDLTTGSRDAVLPEAGTAAKCLVPLVRSMAEADGLLSVEHSLQPWDWFYAVFREARRQLGSMANHLRLCFDPCNLLIPDDNVDVVAISESLPLEELSMVHFKQRRDRKLLAVVADGDVNFRPITQYLVQQKWSGPCLLETAASEFFWDDAAESLDYLSTLGLTLKTER